MFVGGKVVFVGGKVVLVASVVVVFDWASVITADWMWFLGWWNECRVSASEPRE